MSVPGSATAITDALGRFLDELEYRLEQRPANDPMDPFPLGTGVAALDRAFGGGLRIGSVTLLDADLDAQATAVVSTIARRTDHRVLLDTSSVVRAAGRVLAAQADVAAALVWNGQLSDADWDDISVAVGVLAARNLLLSAAGSLGELERIASGSGSVVVLVDGLTRYGPPATVLQELGWLAARASVAVVATSSRIGDLPDWATGRVNHVHMCASMLGARTALIRTDPVDLLRITHLDLDCITGAIA